MVLITQGSFQNGLHVSEAEATAVALGWPRISRQFSVELEFSIPHEECTFYPFRKCVVPTPFG